MPKESGRNVLRALSLLATGLLLGAVLLAASSQSTSGVQQEIIQTAAWRFTSRLQTFLALHALFLAVLGMLFGIVSALWGSRFGVLWFPIGVLGYLCYALLEPRYSPSTNSFLVEICLHFLIGVSAFWVCSGRDSVWSSLLIWSLGFFCIRSLVYVLLEKSIFLLLPGSLLLLYFFVSGLLVGVICRFWNSPMFQARRDDSLERARGSVLRSFFATSLFFFLLTAAVGYFARQNSSEQSFVDTRTLAYSLAATPALPIILAVYGPYTWLSQDEKPKAFQLPLERKLDSSASVAGDRARFFVGIFFEYFLAAVITILIRALRHPEEKARLILAYVAIAFYWLPSIWWIASLGNGSPVF